MALNLPLTPSNSGLASGMIDQGPPHSLYSVSKTQADPRSGRGAALRKREEEEDDAAVPSVERETISIHADITTWGRGG